MIEGLPDVPPSLLLLGQELPSAQSFDDMRRRVRAMWRELREQSEAFALEAIKRPSDSKAASVRFEVHLHGALDLLSGSGCINAGCRIAAADRIARSVGLIADRVWLTDLLSEKFINVGRPNNTNIDDVIVDAMVLLRLLPLIQAGIIRFRSPWVLTCKSCKKQFESSIEIVTQDVTRVFGSEIRIKKRRDGGFDAYTGKCFEPSIIFSGALRRSKSAPTAHGFAKRWIGEELRSALWRAREASLTGGAVLSNSRVGLAGLLYHEGRLVDMGTLLLLDKEREFTVPWVSQLSASQIVELREEASSALPAFREKMARAMYAANTEALSSTAPSGVVAELREQAADVRAELEARCKNSARYWKITYGLLGLGLSAYGVGTDQLLPGVGGLLPIIHLLINHKTGHESEVSKLTSKPGFVLVKAQDILAHADQQQSS